MGRNWVSGHGATFFPGEPTNGYHPLWFLWLSALIWIFGDGPTLFAMVDLSITALLIGFFFMFRSFLRRVTRHSLSATAGACVALIAIAPRAMWGLEMALVAFVAAVVLCFFSAKPIADRSARDAAVGGLLVAVMVLSRLDSAAFIPGLFVVAFPLWDWRKRCAFVGGLSPAFGYAVFNLIVYGHVATTSMAAKSLSLYLPPNWHFITTETPFAGARELLVGAAVIMAVLLLVHRKSDSDIRRLSIALATTPILQLLAQLFLSGWAPYPWYWYFDFMTIGLAVALVVERLQETRLSDIRISAFAVAAVLLAYPLSFQGGLTPNRDIARIATQLQHFAADHPGVYAMGDAAGTPGWVLGRPIVHLEGLMMSHQFLDRIRQGQPLPQVFRDYHVNYYVAVRPSATDPDGCLEYFEPNPSQSSPRSPHLTATVCRPPLNEFTVSDRYLVRIYAVDPNTGAIG
ncbi:hypothetical protein [Mycobacterium sp. OTB74]|uniref:hypothetical protein n=1 Tax=Mycobacterium sp. OTB74 TaxID=1853452 RepID=UPI002474AA9F|nr:hypothetical protein [Mycobacterium sp. OTB74]